MTHHFSATVKLFQFCKKFLVSHEQGYQICKNHENKVFDLRPPLSPLAAFQIRFLKNQENVENSPPGKYLRLRIGSELENRNTQRLLQQILDLKERKKIQSFGMDPQPPLLCTPYTLQLSTRYAFNVSGGFSL